MSARPTPGITLGGIAFGGDYNPEQWPRETWTEDVRLMREAGVDLVSVGIFSWALLEPADGRLDFDWLDQALDTLHAGGVRVDLATATASPPPWLTRAHPEILPERADGVRLWPGGRQAWCPSSPIFREHSLRLVRALAQRYGDHPALVLWHVSNELGGHNALCYCDVSAAAFREWLRERYSTLDRLNDAWGTAFWSQHYGDWEEILPPRIAPTFPNPTQQLDFHRFSSDAVRDQLRAERDLLREVTPDIPITTNFMAIKFVRNMDYWSWAADVDVVSNDHYLDSADPDNHVELAFSADLTRGLAGGRPWLLMEHSTSAVNWQQRNVAKSPGQLRRNSLAHVARGSDAVLFFQWRQSRAGAEKFHSALLPHAGTDTKVWREVCALGADLQRIGEVAGTVVRHQVAMVFDWQSWWAAELDSHPTSDLSYSTGRTRTTARYGTSGSASTSSRPTATCPATRCSSSRPSISRAPRPQLAYAGSSTREAPFSSPTGAASSTSTTTPGSAATPAPSVRCSAFVAKSSSHCATVSRCRWTTVRVRTSGPSCSTSTARKRCRRTSTVRWPESRP
jgi:beta-galactosidase